MEHNIVSDYELVKLTEIMFALTLSYTMLYDDGYCLDLYIFLCDLPLLVTVHHFYIGHICLNLFIFTGIIDLSLVIKVYTEGFRVPVLNRRATCCKSFKHPIV